MRPVRKAIWHRAGSVARSTAEIQKLVKKNPEVVRVQNRVEELLAQIFRDIKEIQANVPNLEAFEVDSGGLEIQEPETAENV